MSVRHLSNQADDLCLIKSTHTDAINHDPAQTFFCTGSEIAGKASMGAWLSYRLGSMIKEVEAAPMPAIILHNHHSTSLHSTHNRSSARC